ncbi:hypothetical protein FG386_000806 [Cryptosporidium ryanae]|uniref:uncharacterized protein n=1 Tax=Cryptosporidium ryanae TaxID=515981 RepID=UPI003519DA23|nr:hypothetical protein FG386_000806 [Cryptosporidium ryanae]
MEETLNEYGKNGKSMGKMSIPPLINENSKEVILLTQEISNIFENTNEENNILNKITEEISDLEKFIVFTQNKLDLIIKEIKATEDSYIRELENIGNNRANFAENVRVSIVEDNKCAMITSRCEEIEKELSNIHDKYALLLEKKKQLLKSMRNSEEVLQAKKKMYQSISMISWSLISDSFIQGHFIPVNSPTRTESFQLQIGEDRKVSNAEYLWSEIEKF